MALDEAGSEGRVDASPTSSAERSAVSDEEASSLCTRCGLCCDGTLFGYVAVSDEEARRLRHRLPILAASGDLEVRFEQRCVALGPRGCDVYAERPDTCARYRCKLLRRVSAGEVDLAAAREVVSKIQALVDRLDRELPPGKNLVARKNLLPRVGAHMAKELAAIIGETWLDVKVLEIMLARDLDDRVRNDPDDVAASPREAT